MSACSGCDSRALSVRQNGMVFRHSKYVLASSPEAKKLQRWGAAGKPRRASARSKSTPAPLTALAPEVPTDPPVTVRCPGTGKLVQLDKPTPPRCPSCKRDDLEVPRFAPSKSFGLLPAHGKTVPADSTEAALPRWEQ